MQSKMHGGAAGNDGTWGDLAIRRVVDDMHIVPMTMSLVHLTGDASVLEPIAPHVHGPWDYSEKVPDELKRGLRDRMFEALRRLRDGTLAPVEPSRELMQRMLDVAVADTVSPEYLPMIRAQMGLDHGSSAEEAEPDMQGKARGFRVAIIGAGVSGICLGIKLKQAGIAFDIIEKNEDVGGTWLENHYPGCAVDTPNHFYQFSFEPNDDWPNYYSRQTAILDYLRHCADKYGLREHIRFGCEARSARYDEACGLWSVKYSDRDGAEHCFVANAMVTAVGQLNRPSIPVFPGLDAFRGVVTHTAEWPEGLDVTGRNVALIGSAASGIQVACAVAPVAQTLTVFQRTGNWIVRSPNIHRAVSEEMKWALKNVPFYAAWYRFQLFWAFADGLYPALRIDPEWTGEGSINAKNDRIRQAMLRYMQKELEDRPDLVEKITPPFPPYGKRVLADPGWFRMLKRENVSLQTASIQAIEPDAIIASDGSRTPCDVIIMATGFHAGRMLWPMEIAGRGGRTVREAWGENDPRAYLGMVAPDFPNMFVLYGPNTGLGHGGSYTFLAECQVRYVMGCLREMVEKRHKSMEIRPDVFGKYNEAIDEELKQCVWSHPAVRTWYKNDAGRIIINSPWRLLDFWRMTLRPEVSEFVVETRS